MKIKKMQMRALADSYSLTHTETHTDMGSLLLAAFITVHKILTHTRPFLIKHRAQLWPDA